MDTIKKLGRYEIVAFLGKGGMGTVYRAKDPVLGRYVALKVSSVENIKDEASVKEYYAKYLKEARLAAQFVHPNIAVTYDAGFENNLFYMAMEFIDGVELEKYTRKVDLLPCIQVLEILYNICHAIEYIHKNGYIHLDIKPRNIMMTSAGVVKLMDFGISRLLKGKPENRQEIAGSVSYMSPEQIDQKKKLNYQTDIFSLGVVAYQLLTGKKPFEGETPFQVFYKIIHEDPIPVHKINSHISVDIGNVVSKAMHKHPEKRFKTARDFADALIPIIKGKDSTALNAQDKKKIDYMRRLVFFKHFQHADLEAVLRISSWRFHLEHSWIVEKSENDNNIYMLILGKATVHIGKEMKNLKPGDCFGEGAVLHNMPRNAKMKAETDCVVMAINANLLNQADASLQVKFLKEFYLNKTLQLVEANLKLIQVRH